MLSAALEHLVRGIVDHPDDVRVDLMHDRRFRILEVRVHPEDLGKVIGRNGRTVRALRQVITGVGGKDIRIEIIDDEDDAEPASSDEFASAPNGANAR